MLEFGAAVSAANEEVKSKCQVDWVKNSNSLLEQLNDDVTTHRQISLAFIDDELQNDLPTGL